MRLHNDMTIGALAARTECSVPTIRYYEEIGLLPEAPRRPGGHRVYGESDLRRLTLIRRCRDFGFPIEQIRELVDLMDKGDAECSAARDVAQVRLDEVRKKLKELRTLEESLKAFVDDCTARCAGGTARECAMLEDLAAPRTAACCSSKVGTAAKR
jgi:MerR family copper efflux transcriptional regulator